MFPEPIATRSSCYSQMEEKREPRRYLPNTIKTKKWVLFASVLILTCRWFSYRQSTMVVKRFFFLQNVSCGYNINTLMVKWSVCRVAKHHVTNALAGECRFICPIGFSYHRKRNKSMGKQKQFQPFLDQASWLIIIRIGGRLDILKTPRHFCRVILDRWENRS